MAAVGANLWGQDSSCTGNLFTITSSNGTSFAASGGATTISWNKQTGGSNACPSFITTTAPWITLLGTNSTSTTGSAGITIAPNIGSATRSGFVVVQSSPTDSTSFGISQTGTTLTVSGNSLSFNAPGGATPLSQTISVAASGGTVQIGASTISSGNWLSVAVSSATTPSTITVSANPTSLAPGSYQGSIQINGAGLQIPVTVSLTVTSPAPSLNFTPSSTTLSGNAGGTTPQPGAVILKNGGTTASTVFTLLTDQPWLTANSQGVTTLGPGQSASVTLSASAANLTPGSYTAHVTAQGTGTSATLTVTFNVGGAAVSALVNPISLSISSGVKKRFAGVEQLSGGNASVAISVSQGSSYLSADTTGTSPGTFGITIDATALPPGSYSGALLVQCTGTTSCLPIPVQVIVVVNPGSGALNFTPTSASLSIASGSSTAQSTSATLENDGSSSTGFTVTADQNWLSATPAAGMLAAGQQTMISVSTNAANLAPGSYTGHVVAQGTSTSGTYTVNLTVTGSVVTVSPNPLTVSLPSGTKQVFSNAVQLGGGSASVTISVTQGNTFFSADSLSQSPGSFSVTADATRLQPGTYPATLVVRCNSGCIPTTVPVSVVVTQGNTNLSFGSPGTTLTGNAGNTAPQTVSTTLLNAGNGPGNYVLASDQTWLSTTPSSGTLASGQSASITVTASAQNLAPGSYTGHVTAGSAIFTVSFTVAGVSLYVLPNPGSFSLTTGTKQTFSTEQVLGGSGPVSISVTSGSVWLSADQAVQAPGSFNITVDATYLKPGSYSGTLSFTCQNACVPFTLPVSVTVASSGLLTFNPASISITSYQGRSTPAAQTLAVKSTDGSPVGFTITNPFSWLTLSSNSGTTPATLTLTPNPAGLTSAASGNLTFTATNNQTTSLLPVTLNIQPFSISATPSPVTIWAITGQHSQAVVNISTVDGGSASLQPSTTNYWLSAPSNVTAPGTLTIKADAAQLAVGQYTGTVSVACAGANPCQALQLPVNFNVTNTAILQSDTQNIGFPVGSNGPPQSTQVVHLTSSDGTTAIPYTIDPTTLPGWLSVSGDNNTTPATLTFSVPFPPTRQSFASVKVNSAYGSVIIAVTYSLSAGPKINNNGVVSAGGSQSQLRSGSWATIYGSNLSATSGRDWNSGDFNGNAFPISLDGVSVTVGGKAAFVRTISPGQINFQCPDGIGTGSVPVVVVNSLGTSNTMMATVASYAPAFFVGTTANSRSYVAATETLDSGVAYIGPANTTDVRPARAGENLTLWGTGFGPTTPDVAAGAIFNGAAPLNDLVQVLIDGVAVTPSFAGLSGAGLYQINIVVPNLSPGDHQLTAMIGGVSTPNGIWLASQ
jgi:uncharacterized protein (TIGR03437 family)